MEFLILLQATASLSARGNLFLRAIRRCTAKRGMRGHFSMTFYHVMIFVTVLDSLSCFQISYFNQRQLYPVEYCPLLGNFSWKSSRLLWQTLIFMYYICYISILLDCNLYGVQVSPVTRRSFRFTVHRTLQIKHETLFHAKANFNNDACGWNRNVLKGNCPKKEKTKREREQEREIEREIKREKERMTVLTISIKITN